MRIEGWHIEGFGIFNEVEHRGLAPGLTVFLGPNETGKSTLLGFLRCVLFGFPSRRSKALQYPPLKGGRHGGRVMLCANQREVVVERFASKRDGLRLNGIEASDQDIQALLGGADESLFRTVFAFSLTEMQSFEWLQAEQVRERIFSAGIAGAGASARQVIDDLEEAAASLYRVRGGCRVKELTEKIEAADERRKQAEIDADRYITLEALQDELAFRLSAVTEEERQLRERLAPMEKLLERRSEQERLKSELAALDPVEEFPPDPETRMATLVSRVDTARATEARLQNEQQAADLERAKLAAAVNGGAPGDDAWIEEFHSRLGRYRDCQKAFDGVPDGSDMRTRTLLACCLAIGACVAFGSGLLTGRGQLYSAAVTIVAAIFGAFLVLRQWIAWKTEANGLKQEIVAWESPVRERLGSSSAGDRLITEFFDFREKNQVKRDLRAKLAAFDETNRGMPSKLEAGRRCLAGATEELQSFLKECGAANEADFFARLRIFRNRKELQEKIAALDQVIEAGSPDDWKSETSRIGGALRELQTRRDEIVGEQRVGQTEMTRIGESPAASSARAELECLKAERAESLREWRVARIARELVARTLSEFTQTRQPAVLEEASAAFERVTGAAYKRILQGESGNELLVMDQQGATKRPEELSRGAAEQLYLCLRLALASEFGRRAEPLPLVMDDVLVNFDPERARAMAVELAQFAEQRQVLLFTCHPETARLFQEAAQGVSVVPMERRRSAAQ